MIDPSDITNELIEYAEDELRANICPGQAATSHEKAAAILNAAIEAGLVSPPVYLVRNVDGSINSLMIPSDDTAIHAEIGAVEHWKGQTE